MRCVPGDPREDDPNPALAVGEGGVGAEGLPQQEPGGAARLRRERLPRHRQPPLLQEHRLGDGEAFTMLIERPSSSSLPSHYFWLL